MIYRFIGNNVDKKILLCLNLCFPSFKLGFVMLELFIKEHSSSIVLSNGTKVQFNPVLLDKMGVHLTTVCKVLYFWKV